MPKSLADGHEKIIILTTKPVNPAAPTLAELNAGIDASCAFLASDWTFGPAASETFNEPAVCDVDNPSAYGKSNGEYAGTIFRQFDSTTKNPDLIADAVFQVVKIKGTTVWVYSRKTAKLSTEALAAGDELRYGAEVLVDTPMDVSGGGYIKNRSTGQIQKSYAYIAVAA